MIGQGPAKNSLNLQRSHSFIRGIRGSNILAESVPWGKNGRKVMVAEFS